VELDDQLAPPAHDELIELSRAVQELRAELDQTVRLATHDPLTGLPNRRTITERIGEVLDDGPTTPVAVLFIDVDRFKLVNDLYGHEVGDRVLVEVADRLREAIGDGDEVARLGGDEFLVLTRRTGPAVVDLGERIAAEVGPSIDVGHRTLPMSVSIGVATRRAAEAPARLVANADAAMYRAKQAGRAATVHYDEHMHREFADRAALERELTVALQDGQLTVHYQPICDLQHDRIVGFEALVRWLHPTRGILPAQEFVPLAEDVGQVWAIDAFVLAETGRQAAMWQSLDPGHRDLVMSVNLSAQQFRDSGVVDNVRRAVDRAGVAPSTFQLEVSETTIMDPRSGSPSHTVEQLHRLGVRLAVDNFGTANSSLSFLKQLPMDVLNIDRRFTSGLGSSPDDEAIVRAVLSLADAFGMDAVAEGIEEPRQAEWLRRAGCRLGQGFLFSRPVTAGAAEALLRAGPTALS
jgi:diguanylate cyclase (GGDEF)-like protein